ncbi:adenine nucleotide alpha hydrolases-like protein [Ascodesmis nigricans]|uniref:FAD synthase n=1 Tax=Ascodesmis nigricans TaxID=341454 RepID=A0A4S2N4L1_9PEZI|nr:adenine nucleotide alpha hydrolases-like protein [Ascodesmis nigricans]
MSAPPAATKAGAPTLPAKLPNASTDPAGETLEEVCSRLNQKVTGFLEMPAKTDLSRRVQEQTRISLGVIEKALEEYTLDQLSLSYNGGKDCLVLLILLLSALHRVSATSHNTSSSASRVTLTPFTRIPSVYVMSSSPFREVDEFVDLSVDEYHLSLYRYSAPIKEAFRRYLEDQPQVKAVFVGTRRTDPHGEFLTHFDKTDHGWPEFMRVHPVIDWHYQEVWGFLRELEIPYCPLYDKGYTSLGGTTDTHPNPVLAEHSNGGESGEVHFRPAYELIEDEQERLGRDR